jgi:uncharacterized membrane protein
MKNPFRRRPRTIPDTAKKNIASIAQIEQEFNRRRSPLDRISDAIARFAGSVSFVVAHIVLFIAWIGVNTAGLAGVPVFDQPPFQLLNLVVALEAIFLSTFVLMSQNRQSRETDQWAHLDLQVSLLAEQETTKILQMLRAICDHLGLDQAARDRELKEMIETTHVETLVRELERARTLEEKRNHRGTEDQ